MNQSEKPTTFGPKPYEFVPNYAKCTTCGKEDPLMQLEHCQECFTASYCSQACRLHDRNKHQKTCQKRNYFLEIAQRKTEPTSDAVFRILSVPGFATFEDVDRAIKLALSLEIPGTPKHYGFLVLNQYHDNPRVRAIENATHLAQAAKSTSMVLHMGPETSMHVGRVKMRMVEAENWTEMGTPKSEAFKKLPWYTQTYCMNNIPSELRTVARVMNDKRFKDCPLEYHYDFDAGLVFDIICTGKPNPTKVITCLGGSGSGFVRDEINKTLANLPVKGYKRTPSAGYGGVFS